MNTKTKTLFPLGGPAALAKASAAALLGALSFNAAAVPFDSNISIQVTGAFDAANFGQATNANQSGTLTLVSGGGTSTSPLVASPTPLSGALTDNGDSIGAALAASSTAASASAASGIGNLFADFTVNIANTSATDTFTVNLLLTYNTAVNADGANAFAQGELILNKQDGTNQFVSDLTSDTSFGDTKFINPDFAGNNDLAPGAGDALTDSGTFLLSYVLGPGASVLLGDNNAEVRIFGGSETPPGSFTVSTNFSIAVQSVVNQQTPPPAVPEPEALTLLAVGSLLLSLSNRSRTAARR